MDEEFRNALPPGQEMEGYRIESVLGAGGFGITYKAIELSLEREVAIKEYLPSAFAMRLGDSSVVVPVSKSQEQDFAWGMTRFKQEAQVLIKLRHPNIVPVLRFFEDYGTAYMVMEYQHGDSLGGVLRDKGALSQDDIDTMFPAVLEALELVHETGFLHRDLKPDNIYVREDGSPVILDFGAARQAMGQRSQSLTAIVSEGYAPYEQYEREGNQGPWTDIYALGAILYRCVTGQRPVEAPARASAAFRGEADPMAPAETEANGEYSPGTFAAIAQAMQIMEKARPQTIAEFTAILDGSVVPDPVPAAPLAAEAPTTMPSTPPGQSLADEAAMAATHMADDASAAPTTMAGDGAAPSQVATAMAPGTSVHEAETRMAPGSAPGGPPLWKRPPVMIGAVAACLLLVVGIGFGALSGDGSEEMAKQDATKILDKAAKKKAEGDMLRKMTSVVRSVGKKAPAAGALNALFNKRRLQTILPGRSFVTLIRFRAGGALVAYSVRPDRDGGDLRETGRWSTKGNAMCLKFGQWNDGKTGCFVVKYRGAARAKKVRFSAVGKAGAFRGTLAY